MCATTHSKALGRVTGRARGRALPWETATLPPAGEEILLWTLAVREDGRRRANAPVVDARTLEQAAGRDDVVVVLDHAGPEAGRWQETRALGPAEVPAPTSGRRPRALDDAGWDDVVAAFARAGEACRAQGISLVLLGASDDGLFASTLSPLGFPDGSEDARRRPLLRALEAVKASGVDVGVVLTVEDLAPGGLDPTAGIEIARAAVGSGVSLVVARAGSAWFPDLHTRPRRMGEDEAWLGSALWLVGRVDVPVYAAGPVVDPERALAIARDAGLAGVLAWEVEGTPP